VGLNMIADISVVIPYFNAESTICRALNSVKFQSVPVTEVVIVNDGSDFMQLEKLVIDFQKHIKIILIDLKENCGAASARNIGIINSTSAYIAFLDADDTWHKDKILIQYCYLLSNPQVVLCGHLCVYLDTLNDGALPLKCTSKIVSSKSTLFKNPFNTPSVVMKNNMGFLFAEGRRFAEDINLWQNISFDDFAVVRLNLPLAYVLKPFFGSSGLSNNLLKMEEGEILNFIALRKDSKINNFFFLLALVYSVLKFIRRLILNSIRRAM